MPRPCRQARAAANCWRWRAGARACCNGDPACWTRRLWASVPTTRKPWRRDCRARRPRCAAAEAAVERIAVVHGGTATVVARCRDRLHRLAFYLERIGRSRTGVERLAELLAAAGRNFDATALLGLLQDCAGRRLQAAEATE